MRLEIKRNIIDIYVQNFDIQNIYIYIYICPCSSTACSAGCSATHTVERHGVAGGGPSFLMNTTANSGPWNRVRNRTKRVSALYIAAATRFSYARSSGSMGRIFSAVRPVTPIGRVHQRCGCCRFGRGSPVGYLQRSADSAWE